jgi:hypothetical protein
MDIAVGTVEPRIAIPETEDGTAEAIDRHVTDGFCPYFSDSRRASVTGETSIPKLES